MLIAAFLQYFFGLSIFISSIFLILLVLVQRGRGGGLTGALGGPGGQSAFGTKAGDLFTRITIAVASGWIVLCALSVVLLKPRGVPEMGLGSANPGSVSGIGGDSETDSGGQNSTDALAPFSSGTIPSDSLIPNLQSGTGSGSNLAFPDLNSESTTADQAVDQADNGDAGTSQSESATTVEAEITDLPNNTQDSSNDGVGNSTTDDANGAAPSDVEAEDSTN